MGKNSNRNFNKRNNYNEPSQRSFTPGYTSYHKHPFIPVNNGNNTQYNFNRWSQRPYQYVRNGRRCYGKYNYYATRRETRERDPSPLYGSEEYTQRKIQETSDMIKRQLMSPDIPLPVTIPSSNILEDKQPVQKESKKAKTKQKKKRAMRKKLQNVLTKNALTYNVKEIHDQIMNHISKLNYGKKQNLINADHSGYDEAIRQIYKQKSLELSKALREMSHKDKPEASEIVNSIIPDFNIKFEELPIHIIRELSSSFEALDRNIGIVDDNAPYNLQSQCMVDTEGTCSGINFTNNKKAQNSTEGGEISEVMVKLENEIKIEPPDFINIQESGEGETVREFINIKDEITFEDTPFVEIRPKIEPEECTSSSTTDPVISYINSTVHSLMNDESDNASHATEFSQINYSNITTNTISNETHLNDESILKCILQGKQHESMPRIRINTEIFSSAFVDSCEEAGYNENENIENDSLINETETETRDFKFIGIQEQSNIVTASNINVEENCIENVAVDTLSQNEIELNDNIDRNIPEIIENSSCSGSTSNLNRMENSNEIQNEFISITIEQKKKPENLEDVTKMMLEIDNEILKLTKLRQSIIIDHNKNVMKQQKTIATNFSGNGTTEERIPRIKRRFGQNKQENEKRKKVQNVQEIVEISNDSTIIEETQCETPIVQHQQPQLELRENENKKNKTVKIPLHIVEKIREYDMNFKFYDIPDVILFCKLILEENTLITGTQNGKLIYFQLCPPKRMMSVQTYNSPISCLDCVSRGNERLVYAGSANESQLTVFPIRGSHHCSTVLLEDGIQVMCSSWDYFFMGGSKGYLTRYNWQTNRIEYEDRISTMSIVDLKATREGARKILVILFRSWDGQSQIHIRDAMSALHMRVVGDTQKVLCLTLHLSSIYISTNEGIDVYDFNDGKFSSKLSTQIATSMTSVGSLLLAASYDGIYVYDTKHGKHVGNLRCEGVSSMLTSKTKVIVGTWTRALKSLDIPLDIIQMAY